MNSARNLLFSGFFWWLLGAALGIYYLSPLFIPGSITKPIKFGIDLVGGTYLSLIVDTDKAVEDTLFERVDSLKGELKQANMPQPTGAATFHAELSELIVPFASSQDARAAIQFLKEGQQDLKITQEENKLFFSLSTRQESAIKRWAVESNIHVLRNRLDKFAVSEIAISAKGDKNIIIELPNIDDPEKAKSMIGKAALLEIVLVQDSAMSEQELLEKHDGELPEGMRIVPRHAEVTGRLLRDARPEYGKMGEMHVSFEFSPEGGKKFYALTSPNIGRTLAVILDNEVISAATIREAIRNRGSISSELFTPEQARELADLLKSGAYVAPVSFGEERSVGPSLGAQSIKQGVMACVLALILLLVFSILYYKIPGIFGFLALLYNLLLILLALAWFKGTLTLPGIAGLVLTIGMAIDSSILVYERIKEELAQGITLQRAIETGFSGAMRVILDANITTFLMGVVLFRFGTGPVQGFAVILMMGILTTLITELFFLRSLFTFVVRNVGVQKMKF